MHSNIRIQSLLSHTGYLSRRANLHVFREFVALLHRSDRQPLVLDVGCGGKPFQTLLTEVRHIGTDVSGDAAADLLADNARLPIRDNSVDAVLASETLEHTREYERAVEEMIRVCRDGGLIYISVPFLFPIHNPPFDFHRLTAYRLIDLFRDHQMILFVASNSIFTAWLMTLGYGIAYASFFLPFSAALTFLPLVLINLLAISIDWMALRTWNLLVSLGLKDRLDRRIQRKKVAGMWTAMPAGYALLIRVTKSAEKQRESRAISVAAKAASISCI